MRTSMMTTAIRWFMGDISMTRHKAMKYMG